MMDKCTVLLMTVGSHNPNKIVFQVVEVHKALINITRVASAGYECHFNNIGGYLLGTPRTTMFRL